MPKILCALTFLFCMVTQLWILKHVVSALPISDGLLRTRAPPHLYNPSFCINRDNRVLSTRVYIHFKESILATTHQNISEIQPKYLNDWYMYFSRYFRENQLPVGMLVCLESNLQTNILYHCMAQYAPTPSPSIVLLPSHQYFEWEIFNGFRSPFLLWLLLEFYVIWHSFCV